MLCAFLPAGCLAPDEPILSMKSPLAERAEYAIASDLHLDSNRLDIDVDWVQEIATVDVTPSFEPRLASQPIAASAQLHLHPTTGAMNQANLGDWARIWIPADEALIANPFAGRDEGQLSAAAAAPLGLPALVLGQDAPLMTIGPFATKLEKTGDAWHIEAERTCPCPSASVVRVEMDGFDGETLPTAVHWVGDQEHFLTLSRTSYESTGQQARPRFEAPVDSAVVASQCMISPCGSGAEAPWLRFDEAVTVLQDQPDWQSFANSEVRPLLLGGSLEPLLAPAQDAGLQAVWGLIFLRLSDGHTRTFQLTSPVLAVPPYVSRPNYVGFLDGPVFQYRPGPNTSPSLVQILEEARQVTETDSFREIVLLNGGSLLSHGTILLRPCGGEWSHYAAIQQTGAPWYVVHGDSDGPCPAQSPT